MIASIQHAANMIWTISIIVFLVIVACLPILEALVLSVVCLVVASTCSFVVAEGTSYFRNPVDKRRLCQQDLKGTMLGRFFVKGLSVIAKPVMQFIHLVLWFTFLLVLGTHATTSTWFPENRQLGILAWCMVLVTASFLAQLSVDFIWSCCADGMQAFGSVFQNVFLAPFWFVASIIKKIAVAICKTLFKAARSMLLGTLSLGLVGARNILPVSFSRRLFGMQDQQEVEYFEYTVHTYDDSSYDDSTDLDYEETDVEYDYDYEFECNDNRDFYVPEESKKNDDGHLDETQYESPICMEEVYENGTKHVSTFLLVSDNVDGDLRRSSRIRAMGYKY